MPTLNHRNVYMTRLADEPHGQSHNLAGLNHLLTCLDTTTTSFYNLPTARCRPLNDYELINT